MDKQLIRKVELVSNGLKGLKIEYKVPYSVKGRDFVRDRKETPKHPTHLAIDNHFNELCYALLDVYGIISDKDKTEIDYEMSITRVTEVHFDGSKFKLKGHKEVVGELPVVLTTPWIDESTGYDGYEGVVAIIEHLYEEVVFYMEGNVKVTQNEIAIKIVTNDKKRGITKADLDAMPDEERKILLSSALEEMYGASVFFPEDVVVGEGNPDDDSNSFVIPIGEGIESQITGAPESPETSFEVNLGDKDEVILPA
jgi:hypothetical protein